MSKVINLNDLPSPDELSSVDNLPSPDQLTKINVPMKSSPGVLESGLRGAEQGATLGFGDEINSALETLLNQSTGNSKGLGILDEYRKHRDESREAFKQAEDAHPYVSAAGNLLGGLALTIATGGTTALAEGLPEVAAMGAKYGAASGLGNSEADLTKGETGKAAQDTALGGFVGAAVAPISQKLTDTVAPTFGKIADTLSAFPEKAADFGPIYKMINAFDQGYKGRDLVTNKGQQALSREISGTTDQLGGDVKQVFSDAARDKVNTLLSEGPKVDIADWSNDANKMMSNLNKNRGNDVRVRDDIKKIQDIIQSHINGVLDEENPAMAVPGKGTNVSTEQAETLLRQLGELGSAPDTSGLKTNEGKQLINRLISPLTRDKNLVDVNMGIPDGYTSLSDLVTQSRPELANQNDTLSKLAKANDALPSTRDITNFGGNNTSGIVATDQIDKFLQNLPPNLQDKYRSKLLDLARAKDVSDTISNTGGLAKGIVEKVVTKAAYGAPNIAGSVTKAMYDMTPDMLKSFANKISSNGGEAYQSLGRIINQASDKDNIGKNALFFALQQNPQYRQILNEMNENK